MTVGVIRSMCLIIYFNQISCPEIGWLIWCTASQIYYFLIFHYYIIIILISAHQCLLSFSMIYYLFSILHLMKELCGIMKKQIQNLSEELLIGLTGEKPYLSLLSLLFHEVSAQHNPKINSAWSNYFWQ